jgi:hypothetical protein
MLQLFTISDSLLLGQVAFFHYEKGLAYSMKPEDPALYHDACSSLPKLRHVWDEEEEESAAPAAAAAAPAAAAEIGGNGAGPPATGRAVDA